MLLDTSIVPLGGKVKVAAAIAQLVGVRVDNDSLQRVISLRNAFAHHATDANPMVYVSRDPSKDEAHYEMLVLGANGKVKRMNRRQALADFKSRVQKAEASLIGLLAAVRAAAMVRPADPSAP